MRCLIHIIGLLLLFTKYCKSQTPCDKANKILEDAISNSIASNQASKNFENAIAKAYRLCPESETVNFTISKMLLNQNQNDRYKQSIFYLTKALQLNSENTEALQHRAAVNFCLGNFISSKSDYEKLNSLISSSTSSQSVLIEQNNFIISYMDSVFDLGNIYVKRHTRKKYNATEVVKGQFAYSLFNIDPFAGFTNNKGQPFSSGIEKELLAIRLGVNDNYKDFLKTYPDNPYSNWFLAESLRQDNDKWYDFTKTKYPSIDIGHVRTYHNCAKLYQAIIAGIPNHTPSLQRLGDIEYINERYEKALEYYKKIIEVLPVQEQSSLNAMQARRMVRRIEWLKSIPGEPVKKNTLFYDKGRLDETISKVGLIGNYLGNVSAKATGNIGYAYAGTAFNFISLLIQEARLNTDWFFKLHKDEKWDELYNKCLSQLGRHINNTGFYSEQSLQMLAGITTGARNLKKDFSTYKNHDRALVDNLLVSEREENLYITAGILAGLELLKLDPDLDVFERYKLINIVTHFDEILRKNNNDQQITTQHRTYLTKEKQMVIDEIKKKLQSR